ncbi:MAG: tyrosine-type recombinase/integrase [Caldilineales bacterium]|nr:tyrosine-type recombinase/integrase [Caldilineales bacterium]
MTKAQRIHLDSQGDYLTPQEAFDAFLLDCQARNLSPETGRFYREKLGALVKWLDSEGVGHVGEITAGHVRAYLIYLRARGHNPGGQHAHASALRAWLNWLAREEEIADNPMRLVRMPKQERQILPAFSGEDVAAMLRACKNRRDIALILAMLDTGLRASELLALNVGDLDMGTGAIMVRKTKNKKARMVYLGAKSGRAAQRYLRWRRNPGPASPLWINMHTGRRLGVWGLRQILRRIAKRSGVQHCHPHTFRRTFALWSLRAGMNIYALQELMGHADLTMLRRYLALAESDLEDAHRRHGPVDTHL